MDFSNRLQLNREKLTQNQINIAEQLYNEVRSNPYKINDLANRLNTSASTISKIIKKLGFPNYQIFVASTYSVEPLQEYENSLHKVSDYYKHLIENNRELLDMEMIYESINYINSAKRIIIQGIGSSGITAEEISTRMERMGYPIKTHTDPHRMQMEASICHEHDLIISISNRGETKCIVQAHKLARVNGAVTLSITNHPDNSLAKNSDKAIILSSYKTINDERFINSQIPILFFFDVVCYELLKIEKNKNKRESTLKVFNTLIE